MFLKNIYIKISFDASRKTETISDGESLSASVENVNGWKY